MNTTLYQQYEHFKAQYPTAVLLFRCGDKYEAYNEDAVKVHAVMGRDAAKDYQEAKECMLTYAMSFPHHQLDVILPKLVKAGNRVAICDQLEKPQNLVKRGITERLTTENPVSQQGAPKKRAQVKQLMFDF